MLTCASSSYVEEQNPVANRLRRWLGDQYDRLAIGLISGFPYQLALVLVLVSLLTRTALASDKLPVIVMLKLRTSTFAANFRGLEKFLGLCLITILA